MPHRCHAVPAAGATDRRREAYLAVFHAAAALLYERTGKFTTKHRGLSAQFASVANDEPGIDRANYTIQDRRL